MKHTFVICAYKESKYLEDCIKSLKAQEVKSDIKIATSTPNEYIYSIANKYKIDVFVNNIKKADNISNIGNDWQFAYNIATTELVTIAHQDDIYLKHYTRDLLKYKKKYPDMTLFTTSSITIKNGKMKFGNRAVPMIRDSVRKICSYQVFSLRWIGSAFLSLQNWRAGLYFVKIRGFATEYMTVRPQKRVYLITQGKKKKVLCLTDCCQGPWQLS